MTEPGNGWTTYSKLVIDTLKRHDKSIEDNKKMGQEIQISLTEMKTELKARITLLTALAAGLPTLLGIAWVLLK